MQTIEVEGRVKWFDPGKGYGFIEHSRGKDVLLHAACMRSSGVKSAPEGASIKVRATAGARGLQAIHIITIDTSTASGDQPGELIEPVSGWELARVLWFNAHRGFGFLSQGDDRPNIFLHMVTVRACGFADVDRGDWLNVRWGIIPRGRRAVRIAALS